MTPQEKELIDAQRKAYMHGALYWGNGIINAELLTEDAEKLYPYRVEKKRRTIIDGKGYQYRVSDSGTSIEYRFPLENGMSKWVSYLTLPDYTIARDLFEKPDEEVK